MPRAAVLLICLIVLGSLGCARAPAPTPAPMVVSVQRCARPEKPVLPHIRGNVPFDHPAQLEALLTRDARLRVYAAGLNDALDCYDAQAVAP